MPATERRQSSRTTMEKLACLQIEPDNGAIVLNVSSDGLCFHSIAPVERNGPVRFSFLEQNRRIDASGELAWTDDLQKIAGMRFTTLTGEAREQIANWIDHPSESNGNGKAHSTSTLGAALLRAFPDIVKVQPEAKTSRRIAESLRSGLNQAGVRIRLTGYSKGLLTGLLISLVWIFALFAYGHRRQFGESLISLGQRLAAKPEIAAQVAHAAPTEVSSRSVPSTAQASPPDRARPQPQPKPAEQAPMRQAVATPSKPREAPASSNNTNRDQEHPAPQAQVKSIAPLSVVPERPRRASTNVAPPAVADLIANKSNPPVFETATARPTPAFSNVEAPPQMFFDVGRFKDEPKARDFSDNLARMGMRTNVVQKGHLWMNAFEVLVGPYITEDEASKVHKDLVAHGFNPRPFERGSRNFLFSSNVTLNGMRFPSGDFKINWESYFADARVQFMQGNNVVTTTRGRWVKRPARYGVNEFVYIKNPDGSKGLVEIHFSGLDQALVFGG
jgi:hypothetical protein